MKLALSVALAATLSAFGYLVADQLTGEAFVRWDTRFAIWLHDHSSARLLSVSDVATLAGNGLVLSLVVAATAMRWIARRRSADAAALVIAFAGAALLTAVFKSLLDNSAPHPTVAFMDIGTRTFPSGHAAGAATVYVMLAFLLGRRARRRLSRVLVSGAAFSLITIVGLSRVLLGTHYLSDVLGGVCLGLACACASLIALEAYSDSSAPVHAQRMLRRPRAPTGEP
jgi:membrane-associated phospholipid phosphatase